MQAKVKHSKKAHSLALNAWRRLRRNKLSMFGLYLILFSTFISLLGSYLRPDDSRDANNQILQISLQKPGFTVKILHITKNQHSKKQYFWNRLLFGGREQSTVSKPVFSYTMNGAIMRYEEFTGSNDHVPGKQQEINLADVAFALDLSKKVSVKDNQVSFNTLEEGKKTMSLAIPNPR